MARAAPSNDLLDYYRSMLLIRRFEERAGQLYGMGLIGGFCHLYIGQEAIAVGMHAAKRDGDQVITGYREHGHMLAAGMTANSVMAELTGRAAGASKGKGGSMHMFSTASDFYGGHGIVGAQVSLGTGLALANRYRDDGKVAFVYFGDGAANQGQVYESFNMAELWRLPAVYVIENNQYAMGTSVVRSSSGDPPVPPRRQLQHPGRGGRRHGCRRRARRRAQGRRARAIRQGAVHPRDEDLSLSRPLDERPRQIPDARGDRRRAQDARPDRAPARAAGSRRRGGRGGVQGHRRRGQGHRRRQRRVRPHRAGARPSELYTDVYLEAAA